ncbi:MAG: YncE family protein [Bacteroidales bacterium]|nr:YncE family protein [Bacteroidales bacterium]
MNRLLISYLIGGCLLLGIPACDDMEDRPSTELSTGVEDDGTAELYILNEGLFNLNNSTLSKYSFASGTFVPDYFTTLNRRGLGDTANDMNSYGGKLYVVVNVSSTVEVVDMNTGRSLRQIPFRTDTGSSRQPRAIAFHEGKAYVCSYDGTVARIDTSTLEIDGWTTAGRNPEDLCVQDDKLYVANSGGLDWEGVGVDRTVSVIDLQTFRELKQIEVGPNPGRILPGPDHTVWVAIHGEAIEEGRYQLAKINTLTDTCVEVFDEPVMDFAVDYSTAYLYNYDYATQQTAFKVFDLQAGTVIRPTFITDGTRIERPYSIQVNPYSGNVYITEAYNYQLDGDVYCFTPQGQLKFRLPQVGLNPNTVLFSDEATGPDAPVSPDDTDPMAAYATRVLDYRPAPTQYMNTTLTAWQDSFTSKEQVLAYAARRLQGKSLLSLGAYGGYIELGFDEPVPNVPGEYDLKVYGNAYYNAVTGQGLPGGSSEPGIVLVSADANGNELADDPWYELAGSEYGKDTETREYEIIYHRPVPSDADVRWTDNQGNEGYVFRNSFHTQDSYWPVWVTADSLTFRGTRLRDNAVEENGIWVGYCYGWGYADNHPNTEEATCLDIDWAVDAEGRPAGLQQIDFVRIYTAVNQSVGVLGEMSTEITGVENLHYQHKSTKNQK